MTLIAALGSLLAALIGVGVKIWLGSRNSREMNAGINKEKADAAGEALEAGKLSQTVTADVNSMSDDEVRKSRFANSRD